MAKDYMDNPLTQAIRTVQGMKWNHNEWVSAERIAPTDPRAKELQDIFERTREGLLQLFAEELLPDRYIFGIYHKAIERASFLSNTGIDILLTKSTFMQNKRGETGELSDSDWETVEYYDVQEKIHFAFEPIARAVADFGESIYEQLKAADLTMELGLPLTLFLLDRYSENPSKVDQIRQDAELMLRALRDGVSAEDVLERFTALYERRMTKGHTDNPVTEAIREIEAMQMQWEFKDRERGNSILEASKKTFSKQLREFLTWYSVSEAQRVMKNMVEIFYHEAQSAPERESDEVKAKIYFQFWRIYGPVANFVSEVAERYKRFCSDPSTAMYDNFGVTIAWYIVNRSESIHDDVLRKDLKLIYEAQQAGLTTEDVIETFTQQEEARRRREKAKLLAKLGGEASSLSEQPLNELDSSVVRRVDHTIFDDEDDE